MEISNQHSNVDLIVKHLSGELSPTEVASLMEWVNASDTNKVLYHDLKESWTLVGDTTNAHQTININQEWQKLETAISSRAPHIQKNITMRLVMSIAASILVIVGLSVYGYLFFNTDIVSTGLAQTTVFELPDASEVTLNENSELTYQQAFNRNERRVKLKGEGFFKVSKNKERPFVVETSGVEVIVLGTSFNVKISSASNSTEVTVAEGVVRVQPIGKPEMGVVIKPGEKALMTETSQKAVKEPNRNQNFDAWKTHTLTFDGDSLSKVARQLAEVYHKQFKIESDEVAAYTLSTTFDNKNLETVLLILESTFDMCIEQNDSIVTFKKDGCR